MSLDAPAFGWHTWLMNRLRGRRGQNTVEYLLMLTVVVGVVLAAGIAMKRFFPGLIENIKGMISGTAGALGGGNTH